MAIKVLTGDCKINVPPKSRKESHRKPKAAHAHWHSPNETTNLRVSNGSLPSKATVVRQWSLAPCCFDVFEMCMAFDFGLF
ncbi:hypothetical protein CDAR_194181 [Caerostris darwini]|uniref:Uncharacterized protein n=1 Tax=Caerostris darwini TaxID=1538125 RepID=A0AAV4Q032_9ARAC|nr:hypothetical protein CDAR_194181 [Caerostris darwini]